MRGLRGGRFLLLSNVLLESEKRNKPKAISHYHYMVHAYMV